MSKYIALLFFLMAFPAYADGKLEMQFLYGGNYELGEEERYIVTLDYYKSWDNISVFGFFDITSPFDENANELYGESYVKTPIMAFDDETLVATVSLMGGVQADDAAYSAWLLGPTFDLRVPGFDYSGLDVLLFKDTSASDETYSITPYWQKSFNIGAEPFRFRGFVSFYGEYSRGAAQISAQPQLLWDVYQNGDQTLSIGIEYQYYRNKYGVAGVDEHNAQALVVLTL